MFKFIKLKSPEIFNKNGNIQYPIEDSLLI